MSGHGKEIMLIRQMPSQYWNICGSCVCPTNTFFISDLFYFLYIIYSFYETEINMVLIIQAFMDRTSYILTFNVHASMCMLIKRAK